MADLIVIFSRSLPFHHIGGMEVVAWDMAMGLANKGYQVKLVTTPFKRNKLQGKINNLEIYTIDNASPGKYSKNWWKGTEQVMKELISYTSNIKAIISVSAGGFRTLKFKSLYKSTVFILQVHGTSFGEFLSKWKKPTFKKCLFSLKNIICFFTDAFYYKGFDSIVAVGPTVEDGLKKIPTRLILDVNKIKKIENGIDNELFAYDLSFRKEIRNELNIPYDALVCFSASRLHVQKGVDDNIHVFKKIIEKNNNSYYLICGTGEEQTRLKRLVNKYNLSDRILFLGEKNRSELAKIMNAADVFLFLTNREEGLPLNVLEAMSSGLPIVISEHLHYDSDERVRKVIPTNHEEAALVTIELYKSNRNIKRNSYIAYKNTLNASINEYIRLF